MKNNSFLFYICTLLYLLSHFSLKAQEPIIDSLIYYHNEVGHDNNLIKSHAYFIKHKNSSLKIKDTISVVFDLTVLSIIEYKLSLFHESELTSIEAIKLIENVKKDNYTNRLKISLYNQIGLLYRAKKNYNKALDYYNKIIETSESPFQFNIVLNNRANVYRDQEKYKFAELEYQKAYDNSLLLNDTIQIARALDNLGFTQIETNSPSALSNMLEALKIREHKNHSPGIYTSYLHLSKYYKKYNQPIKALSYANKAYDLSKAKNNDHDIVESLSHILDLSNTPQIKEYKKLTDSIALAKQLEENKFAAQKYDFSEERRKRAQSELELEKENQSKIIYSFLFIIAVILAFAYAIYQRLKHKKDIVSKVHQTESHIAKKVHDEVANDVYQTMVKVQSSNNKEEILDDLEHIYSKTRDISKQFNAINLEEGFKTVFEDLILAYKNDDVNIVTTNFSKINWKNISEIKKTVIHRVVQELLTNMKKYSKANLVIVSFKTEKNKLLIKYTDDGVGCNINKSGGLLHTETRIQSVGGSITFESEINNGFKATIKI